jgi:Methyltransferase domain
MSRVRRRFGRHDLQIRQTRMSPIEWFESRLEWERGADQWYERRLRDEATVLSATTVCGWCDYCAGSSTFELPDSGRSNLRESLRCTDCRLINRSRLLYRAILDTRSELLQSDGPIYLAERLSPFYERLQERFANVEASEYVDIGNRSGSIVEIAGQEVVHQDLRELSYPDKTFALAIHAEVLEHVAGYRAALGELRRVVRLSGATVFTAPFVESRMETVQRAVVEPNGEIRHILEPEMHGNPLSDQGSLVFQVFGWELLDDLREAGFKRAAVGFLSAPERALTNGVVFRAWTAQETEGHP